MCGNNTFFVSGFTWGAEKHLLNMEFNFIIYILSSELNSVFMNVLNINYWTCEKNCMWIYVCFKITVNCLWEVLCRSVRICTNVLMIISVSAHIISKSHDQSCNLVNAVVCVSEFPPFHLEAWCQVKLTCSSLNSPIIVHTCKEKFLYSHVIVLWTNGVEKRIKFLCLHVHLPWIKHMAMTGGGVYAVWKLCCLISCGLLFF